MRYWVYILECSDGKYYVGSYRGPDPAIRTSEHNTGKYHDAWTAKRLPVKLVWCSEFQRITDAIDFEQRIKRWRRAKKEAVIRGDWTALPELATAYSRKLQD
jgi:putative endonuclease